MFPDTNVSVEYGLAIPEILARKSRTYLNLVAYLDMSKSRNRLKICQTVEDEFKGRHSKAAIEKAIEKVMKKHFADYPDHRTRRRFLDQCTKRFDDLRDNCMISDNDQKLPDVKAMYGGIWDDPSQDANRKEWFEKKSKNKPWFKDKPPAGNDLTILSTAAHLQEDTGLPVEFITADNDFLAFREKIRQELGIFVTAKYAFDPDDQSDKGKR